VAVDPGNNAVSRSRFARAVLPIAVVLPLSVAALLYVEFSLPPDGVAARTAYAEDHGFGAWRITWILATALAALPLVVALVRDRRLIAEGTDREQSHYLGIGALLALVGTFLGSFPAALVGLGLVAGAAWMRRGSTGPEDERVPRDLRTGAFVAVAGLLTLFVAREVFRVYATWRFGFGVEPAQVEDFAAEHGRDVAVLVAYVVATAASLMPLLMLVRHRARLSETPGLAVGVGLAVVVLALIAQAWPLVALGVVEVVLGVVWSRRSAD